MRGSGLVSGVFAVAVLAVSVAGCGHDSSPVKASAEHELTRAADVSTCTADAKPLSKPYGDGFPAAWTFPPETTVYNYEDRGGSGTIVTGISSADFKTLLAYLNKDMAAAGFKIENGETEEHDAEAEWEGNGYRGRWAIRESAQCPGETVVQVLAGTD